MPFIAIQNLNDFKLVVFPENDPILDFSFNKSENLITLKTLKIVIEHNKEMID
jgi:hypothetical protein